MGYILGPVSSSGQMQHAGLEKRGLEIKQWWTLIRFFWCFRLMSWLSSSGAEEHLLS
jgi:hypothetical protein